MLDNFQLVAIVKLGGQTRLLQFPLHQQLQQELAESWQTQFNDFMADIQEIDFNPGYKPERHERFQMEGFLPPEWLAGQDSESAANLDPINEHEDALDAIKGVVAFAFNEEGEELVLFQNFNRSHVIRPGRFLLLQHNTYESSERPGLTLNDKLSAAYWPEQEKLLFHNFRTVNSFLPLADFYEEASENEIKEILEHALLAPEDADALAAGANQWFRKRFAMLKDSGILDQYSAQQIADHSVGYEVNVELDGGQIVFPADKGEAKRLLQFLNEEIFRGAITETLYETNSKREAD